MRVAPAGVPVVEMLKAMKFFIHDMDSSLLEKSLPLIASYQEFYGVKEISDKRNFTFFGELLKTPEKGRQFVALDVEHLPIGFATIYIQRSSLSAKLYCLMNDLYTVPELRGKGIGRALILHCRDWAASQGFSGIEWMTQDSNTTAQRLYNDLSSDKSAWFCYSLRAT